MVPRPPVRMVHTRYGQSPVAAAFRALLDDIMRMIGRVI